MSRPTSRPGSWLPQAGLYYYKARVYSPTLGRFMQTDSIGYDDGLNWYAYVGNDPMNKGDPTGLAAAPCGGEGQPQCDVSEFELIAKKKVPKAIERERKRQSMESVRAGLVTWTKGYLNPSKQCEFALTHLGDMPFQVTVDAVVGTFVGERVGNLTGTAVGKILDSGPVLGSTVGRSTVVGARAGRIGGVAGALAGAVAGTVFKDELERGVKRVCHAK